MYKYIYMNSIIDIHRASLHEWQTNLILRTNNLIYETLKITPLIVVKWAISWDFISLMVVFSGVLNILTITFYYNILCMDNPMALIHD